MNAILKAGECLELMRELPTGSVDMVFGSPPYENRRTYGIGFNLKGQAWVDWAVERYLECLRVCNGLVGWVVEGKQVQFRYTATPILLMADLHRAGVHLRKPPAYKRQGISGSGGPDWLRNDYEFVVCATNGGKLPWSNKTAMGHPPKQKPGGRPSSRKQNGERTRGKAYKPPALSNPGNVIDCGAAGGGNMGHKLCHENEAPFSEKIAEFFIESFCPPGGLVLDPFAGSGTTLAVAQRLGRRYIGFDIRESQIELCRRRLAI